MSAPVTITVLDNGPLKVSGASSARFCGERLPVDGDLYLCRCGRSANAPFCDGTHRSVGFDGSGPEQAEQPIRTWEGRTLQTFFNAATCMHVLYCKPLDGLRAAELAGDDAAAEEIIRVVETCPSGALSYARRPAQASAPMADGPVCLDIMQGGEVRIQVPFVINRDLHERQAENRATLCRCGASASKPWCDGRHRARRDFR